MALPRVLLVNDHRAWGGIGKYTWELDHALRALAPPPVRLDLLLQNLPGRSDAAAWRAPGEGIDGSPVLIQPRPRWAKPSGYGTSYLVNSHLHFPRRIPAGYDLYHFSSQMMGASVRHARPAVVTVHDLIALHLGSNHPGVATWLRRRHFRPLLQATGLIFVSEFSRQDFLARFDYPEARTSVIHHGVDSAFAPADRLESRAALGLPTDRTLLLHVGSEERRKNVETLLDALALLTRERPELLLLRVGGQSSRSRRRIARHGLSTHVRYVAGLSEPQLVAAYSAADLFVFPSYFEGFGLPVLEALKCGCPVIASRATSIPEITGDAALLVDPADPTALAGAMSALLDDAPRRAAQRAAGLARAATFTWERTARETATTYRRALELA